MILTFFHFVFKALSIAALYLFFFIINFFFWCRGSWDKGFRRQEYLSCASCVCLGLFIPTRSNNLVGFDIVNEHYKHSTDAMIRKLTSREMSSVSSALRCVLDKIEAAADKRKKVCLFFYLQFVNYMLYFILRGRNYMHCSHNYKHLM